MSADPWGGPLLIQAALILVSGWFAAAEAALMSLNEAKLRNDAEENDRVAVQLLRLTEEHDKFLTTIKVCITLAGFLGCAFAASWFTKPLADAIIASGAEIPAATLDTLCLIAVTLVLAFFTLVLGYLVPRRIALQDPDKSARRMCNTLMACTVIFRPVVWMLSAGTNGILRLIGIDPHAEVEEVTEEEIRLMVDMGGESGAIEETEKEMIENIFEFNNRSAEDVMTHRIDVTSIWVGEDKAEIIKTIRETGLSRFPVYDEDMDDIIGTLNTRVFLLNEQSENPKPLRELIRDAYFVPETVQADALFRDMQMKKIHMAIVVDEYGGMSGLVTMEDLLEEIVGNIYDEFDPQAEAEIVRVDDETWRISGAAVLEDVADALGVELPQDEEYDTLGGLIFSQFTAIPKDGSTPEMDVAGLHIQVEKIEDHRVESALVRKLPEENDGEGSQEDQADE